MTKKPTPTRREYEVLDAIIQEIKQGAPPPTKARLCEILACEGNALSRPLEGLEAKGLAASPYRGGPWVPKRDLAGQPVALRITLEAQEEAHP